MFNDTKRRQGRFYVGAGDTCPQIQKLADRSDVISEVPKCSRIKIFRGSAALPRNPLEELTVLP